MSRFPVLATISVLLKVLAVLVVLVGFIGGIAAANDTDPFGRSDFNAGVLFLVWVPALISGVVLWAYAEIIAVVLAIEDNTFRSAELLGELVRAGGPRAPGSSGPAPIGSSLPQAPYQPAYQTLSRPGQRPVGRGGQLSLWPPSGSPGTTVQAQVDGVPAGSVINLDWFGGDGTAHRLVTVNATLQGHAIFSFTAPDWETAGARQVVASASWGRAAASFTVVGG